MSPIARRIILITNNRTNNIPDTVAEPRSKFLAGRDFTPLVSLDAESERQFAPSQVP